MHANRLGAAADHTGTIKLFTNTHVLKQFTYHRARVNAVRLYEGKGMLSCSDDGTVVWNDLESVNVLDGHNDYVRAVCVDGCAVVSGALDGCMLVHDLRESARVAQYVMDEPVMHLESSDGAVYVCTPTGITHFSVAQRAAVRSTVNYGINDLRVCDGLVYVSTAHSLTVYDRNLEEVFFCRFKDESAGLACVNGEVLVGLKSGTILGVRTYYGAMVENDSLNVSVANLATGGRTSNSAVNACDVSEMVYDAMMSRSALASGVRDEKETGHKVGDENETRDNVEDEKETRDNVGDEKETRDNVGDEKETRDNVGDELEINDEIKINNEIEVSNENEINDEIENENRPKNNKNINNNENNNTPVHSSLYYKENEHPILILKKPFKTYDQYEQMLNRHEYRRCLTAVLTTNNKHRTHHILRYLHVHDVLRQAIFKRNVRLVCSYLCKHIGDVLLKSTALKGLVIVSAVFERMLVMDRRMLRRIHRAVKRERNVQKECIRAYAYIESVLER